LEKLELPETAFKNIFDLAGVSNIILDKDKKIFEIVFFEYPLIEIFLHKKFTTVIFHGESWTELKITSSKFSNGKNSKKIDTIEKINYIPRFRIMNEKIMFCGKGAVTGDWINIVFSNLLLYGFYGAE